MGWKVITGSVDHPSVTGRDSFREVLIKDDLAKALKRINLRDDKPWLDASRIAQAIGALERIGHALMKRTRRARGSSSKVRPSRASRTGTRAATRRCTSSTGTIPIRTRSRR